MRPDLLSKAVELIETSLSGGPRSVEAFKELIMLQLGQTVLDKQSFICVQWVDGKSNFVLASAPRQSKKTGASGGLEVFQPLKLNNGYFLDLRYCMFVDNDDSFLKTKSSRVAYQSDLLGYDQFFRFEMERNPKNHYPFSHVHVNGNWKRGDAKRPKDLEKNHFPVVRPTIENLIRLLVYDFDVPSHLEPKIFEPILRECERRFLRVARTTPKKPQPLPPQ